MFLEVDIKKTKEEDTVEESCKLYLVTDGDPNNLSEDNLASMGAYTVFSKSDWPIRIGDGLKMNLVHEERMDEPVQLKIVQIIGEGATRKLILCSTEKRK